jgi:hypothetical protein
VETTHNNFATNWRRGGWSSAAHKKFIIANLLIAKQSELRVNAQSSRANRSGAASPDRGNLSLADYNPPTILSLKSSLCVKT